MSTWSRQKYSYSHFSTSPHSLKCSYSPTPHAFDTPNSREDCSEERDFIILSNGTERMCFSRRLPLSLFSYQVPPRWRDPSKRNVHLPVSSKAAGLLPVPRKSGHCCCSLLSCSRGASYQGWGKWEKSPVFLNKWMRNWEIVIGPYTLLHYV